MPLYSRKLHIRVRRARTSCVTSFTILALSFGESVVNHLARRWIRMCVRRQSYSDSGGPAHHFALSRQEDQVAAPISKVLFITSIKTYWIAIALLSCNVVDCLRLKKHHAVDLAATLPSGRACRSSSFDVVLLFASLYHITIYLSIEPAQSYSVQQ
jgi:hypothetical protein